MNQHSPVVDPSLASPKQDGQPRPSRRSISEWTHQRLCKYLVDGRWMPGDVVNEMQLTQELGVSRSPIREGLAELEREGLLIRSPQDGRRYVITFERSDVEHLYDLRAALECLAIRYLAPTVTDEILFQLQRLLDEMTTVEPGNDGRGRSFAADFEYHELVVRAAGALRLYGTLRQTWLQTRVLLADLNRRAIYPTSTEIDRVVHEHQLVHDTLRARDAEAAAAALGAHIMGAKDRVLSVFGARGGM